MNPCSWLIRPYLPQGRSRTAGYRQRDNPMLNPPPGTISGGWTVPAKNAVPCTGSVSVSRRGEVLISTRCLGCVAVTGPFNCPRSHPHPTRSKTSSWDRQRRPDNSANTSDSTIQHSRSLLSEPRLMTVSIEVEVDHRSSGFTVNFTTKLVPSSPPTDKHPSTRSSTSLIPARRTTTEWGGTVA